MNLVSTCTRNVEVAADKENSKQLKKSYSKKSCPEVNFFKSPPEIIFDIDYF